MIYFCEECGKECDGTYCRSCCTHESESKNGVCLDCGGDV